MTIDLSESSQAVARATVWLWVVLHSRALGSTAVRPTWGGVPN